MRDRIHFNDRYEVLIVSEYEMTQILNKMDTAIQSLSDYELLIEDNTARGQLEPPKFHNRRKSPMSTKRTDRL